MMTGDGIGEAPSPYQRLFQAISVAVSNHSGEEGQSLRNECKFAVARGDFQPDKDILKRILSWAVHNGNSSLVAEVVRLGATVSCAKDFHHNSGYSLLLSAVHHGKEDIVGWLLVASAGGDGSQGRSVALQIACVMGRVGVVKALLADGTYPSPSASAKDNEPRKPSAFEMAAKCGHVGVMRVLLQHHARGAWAECGDSARGINNVLRTVIASPNNTADVIDFLVNEAGADVDARNDHGDTLLHEAVLWDSLEATVALLRHGADVEAVNEKGDTPLFIAAGFGKQSVFEALAEAGANIHHRNSRGLSVLDKTAIAGNLETLGALVRRKVDVRAIVPTGSSSLHWAAINNKEAAIGALIAAGADDSALDETGYSPLHWASMTGKISAIAALAAAGTDINRRTSQDNELTALDWAAFRGNVDALKVLVENGADVRGSDTRGYTPLHFAVECNSVGASEASCEAITALLLYGAEVNAADKKGKTPLVMAVKMEKLALADALVAGGADVNRRNVVDDMAPLDVAAFIGNLGVLKALLGYGARAKSVNSVGATALHRVAGFKAAGLVHALVDAGADVSAEDANGMAPIHYASISGSPTAIVALVQRELTTKSALKMV